MDKIKGTTDRRLWLNGIEVRPTDSQKLVNHSPDGFAFGYCGSGPAQAALAILLAYGIHDDAALSLYQQFKESFVANWPQNEDFLAELNIGDWIGQNYTLEPFYEESLSQWIDRQNLSSSNAQNVIKRFLAMNPGLIESNWGWRKIHDAALTDNCEETAADCQCSVHTEKRITDAEAMDRSR